MIWIITLLLSVLIYIFAKFESRSDNKEIRENRSKDGIDHFSSTIWRFFGGVVTLVLLIAGSYIRDFYHPLAIIPVITHLSGLYDIVFTLSLNARRKWPTFYIGYTSIYDKFWQWLTPTDTGEKRMRFNIAIILISLVSLLYLK